MKPTPDYETRLLQDRAEHNAFLALLLAEKVQSYLEIGLGYGGSFWRVGNTLPMGSRLVGVDKTPVLKAKESYAEAAARIEAGGRKTSLIFGNSTDELIVAQARELAPFDCVFIDGDHSYEGCKADWLNYGSLGRMVAFHDISWDKSWVSKVPGRVTQPMGVPKVWDEAKQGRRHKEIKLYHRHNYYGIGVLWNESRESAS